MANNKNEASNTLIEKLAKLDEKKLEKLLNLLEETDKVKSAPKQRMSGALQLGPRPNLFLEQEEDAIKDIPTVEKTNIKPTKYTPRGNRESGVIYTKCVRCGKEFKNNVGLSVEKCNSCIIAG